MAGPKSLRGDFICFCQEGPAEALKLLGNIGAPVRQRIDWVKQGGSFRVVCVDDNGQMENWLHDNSVLIARPWVIFNELRVREKLDEVMGNLDGDLGPIDETYEEDFVAPMDELASSIFNNARFLKEDTILAVEALSQVFASDIAGVRQFDDGDAIDSVGLMSSSEEILSEEAQAINALVHNRLRSKKREEAHQQRAETLTISIFDLLSMNSLTAKDSPAVLNHNAKK